MGRSTTSSDERHDPRGHPPEQTVAAVRRWPLVGVLAGVGIFAAGLVGLYLVMRTVGLEYGGACVSGGPYEIRPGQECESGVFAFAFSGIGGIAVGALLFLWSSFRYGGQLVVTSASGAVGSAFFGGLGGSFLSIGAELPASSAEASEFRIVGIMFVVFAAIGLPVVFGPLVYAARSRRLDIVKPTTRVWVAWFAAVAIAAVIGVGASTLVADAGS